MITEFDMQSFTFKSTTNHDIVDTLGLQATAKNRLLLSIQNSNDEVS